jgi:hypothetical protein
MIFVLGLLAECFVAPPAAAIEKCSVTGADAMKVEGSYGQAVEAAVRRAPNCERAYKVLEACSLGSSWDNRLDDIVQSKCAPLFMNKADAATKKAFKKAKGRCDKIAERNSGTMYQSLAAVCRARAARDFARRRSGGK